MGSEAGGFDCPEAPERRQFDIPDRSGLRFKLPSHSGHMIHAVLDIRQHGHEGHSVVESIHRAEHIHAHLHVGWRNRKIL